MKTDTDQDYMLRACALAEQGRGAVEPNPLVGAVVVRHDVIVGEGWHQRFGAPHAEIHALNQAGHQARGATLYVSLEPCCHNGKTPPCTDAIIKAGIARVVTAMLDPFPEVAGRGTARLREAGIPVDVGTCADLAHTLNAPYLKLLRTGRPYVIGKWAMSLDGKIASSSGDSRWISNEESRRRSHIWRGRVDAIIVGVGTALIDDPLLTPRPPGPRLPVRIVLDSKARLPLSSQLAQTARDAPVLVVTAGHDAPHLNAMGCEVLGLGNNRVDLALLLDELGRRRMTNVLVEGGASVLGAFLPDMDEVRVFIAPCLIGGKDALSPLAGQGAAVMAKALQMTDMTLESLGNNWLIQARLPHRGRA